MSATDQGYPENTSWFDNLPQVLCREKIDGAKKWSIKWSGEEIWIGVSYGSIQRKGDGSHKPAGKNVNSWALHCTQSVFEVLHNKEQIPTGQHSFPRIGVEVNMDGGKLAFYGIKDERILLHTFYCTFTESVYAAFFHGDKAEIKLLA
ncbi:STXB protein, partial [Atractosteus spatula]|nr:STXB protein [Atractosteus spatula]